VINRGGPFRVKHIRALGITKRQAIDWVEKGYIRPDVKEAKLGRGDIRLFSYKNLVEFAFLYFLYKRGVSVAWGHWELRDIEASYDLRVPPAQDRDQDYIWVAALVGPEGKWHWKVSASEETVEAFEEGKFGGEISPPFHGRFEEVKKELLEHIHTSRVLVSVNLDNLKRTVDHVLQLVD